MPNRFIYVLDEGILDHSRWLSLGVRPDGETTIYLSDLCHPGRLSSLKHVTCDLQILKDGLRAGTVQVVSSGGYVLLRRDEDVVQIEFRGLDDTGPSKVQVRAVDLFERLESAQVVPVTTA